MSYKPQEMENSSISGSIYALASILVWTGVTIANVQAFVSVLGGLIAAVSGAISIYKNLNKPK